MPCGLDNASLRDDRTFRDSYWQVAEALGHLPGVGYIHVLKTADGAEQTYTVPADAGVSGASDTVETFSVWEWEITFVTKAGDLPLMAAVWSDGRTSLEQDGGFELSGRAARFTCGSCDAFGGASWSSAAETVVGLRMEVSRCVDVLYRCCHNQRPNSSSYFLVSMSEEGASSFFVAHGTWRMLQ